MTELSCNATFVRTGLRALVIASTIAVAGCSLSTFLDSAPVPPSREPVSEPAYKQIVAADFVKQLASPPPTGPWEISELRRSQGPQPGAWMTCVRQPSAPSSAFAVFIEDHKLVNVRQAVALDGCDREQFQMLPAVAKKEADSR